MPLTVLFDDGAPLGPLTDLRPVFDVRTGVATTRERWIGTLGAPLDGVIVPERLRALCAESRPDTPVNSDLAGQHDVMLLNGACVLPPGVSGLGVGEWIADRAGRFLAGRFDGATAQGIAQTGTAPETSPTSVADNHPLLARVSDLIRLRDQAITLDLHHYAPASCGPVPEGVHVLGDAAVVFGEKCAVLPGTVIDATNGPVYIASGAIVRTRCSLIGPCAVLEGATVSDGAVIRANTVIGPVCKAGGEIGGTIFQGHANKGHDGYLGDAYVGAWVNLGAGTNNSNLLNTYREVAAAPHLGAEREGTGLTFFGCVVGDHAKTAIGTRVMTGTLIGTGAMCASSVPPPSVTDRFLWLTDGEPSRYRWGRFEETARAVMARREKAPGVAYLAALKALHDGQGA